MWWGILQSLTPTKENPDPGIIYLIYEGYFVWTIETNIASINKTMWKYNSTVEVWSRVPHYSIAVLWNMAGGRAEKILPPL